MSREEQVWPPPPSNQPQPPQPVRVARWEHWCGLLSAASAVTCRVPLGDLFHIPPGVAFAWVHLMFALYPVSIAAGAVGWRTWGGKIGLGISLGFLFVSLGLIVLRHLAPGHGW